MSKDIKQYKKKRQIMRKFLSQNGKQQAEINFPGINQAFPYIYNN